MRGVPTMGVPAAHPGAEAAMDTTRRGHRRVGAEEASHGRVGSAQIHTRIACLAAAVAEVHQPQQHVARRRGSPGTPGATSGPPLSP